MTGKPSGLSGDVWASIMRPSPTHHCYECRHCKPVPMELRAKGKAHSYCDSDRPVITSRGMKINGLWYTLVSAKNVTMCKHFEPVKGGAR